LDYFYNNLFNFWNSKASLAYLSFPAAVFVEKYFWGPDEEEQPAPASAIESIQFVDDQNSLRNQIMVNEIFEKI